MQKIPFTIGNASAVGVAKIDSSLTASIAVGGASVFAAIGVFARGPINQAIQVNASNLTDQLGAPFHPSKTPYAQQIRQLSEAVEGGAGWVVNIARTGMKIPGVMVSSVTGEGVPAATEGKAINFAYGDETALTATDAFMLHVKDGDKSANRFITFEAGDVDGTYNLIVKEQSDLGVKETVESMVVSLSHDAVSDSNEPLFIESVLENESSILAFTEGTLSLIDASWAGFTDLQLTGGDDGDISQLQPSAITAALKGLDVETITFNVVIAAGIFDLTAITGLAKLAEDTRTDFFYDISGSINPEKALLEARGSAMQSRDNVSRYYFPYKAIDPYTNIKMVWGLSGSAFKAKALGVAKNDVVGGYHYSAAGVERGMIVRTGITPLSYAADIDREAFAAKDARINVAASAPAGGMCIDDALTTWGVNDDKRYQHVVSTVNSISRRIFDICTELKHEPDGVTYRGVEDRCTALLDQYVGAEALVTPTDTAKYGEQPYILEIKKLDKDFWQITPYLCVTGTSRRFMIRPVLIP